MKKITSMRYAGIMLLFLFAGLNGRAQAIADIQTSFNRYSQNALQEKVFVHTDKSAYLSGEILWFKLYVVDGSNNQPLDLSKVAYVEVLDNSQNPVLQAKVALTNGSGHGSIYLPVSINNGSYKLRAYTNWMKNFGADYFFEKNLTIINPSKSPDADSRHIRTDYDIQFFPEGGNLISGLAAKIAFKATGSNGKGIGIHGAVIDQHNDTVVRFKTLKFGMGSFMFTPLAGNNYKAVVYADGNKAAVKELPGVNEHGYIMQLTDGGVGQLNVTVKTNTGTDGQLYLFAHTRQREKIFKARELTNGTASFSIDKNALGDGVSGITIFNDARRPVCERLYFKRPQKKLLIVGSSDQQQYGIRKKVNIDVIAKDQSGKALAADMSVAVYHLDSLQTADSTDILSYLWLNADLRGNIQSPGYYLNNTDAEADEALDNLMLTQGWRRFKWDDVFNKNPVSFTYLPEYNGHLITGHIINNITNAPARGVITYLGVPGKRVQLSIAESDSTGRLLFNTRNLFGPGEIVVQPDLQKDSVYHIDILTPFYDQFSKTSAPAFYLAPGVQSSIESLSLGMQVQNIYSGNKIRLFYDNLKDSSAFYNKPDKTYKLDDFTRFTTMEEVLIEYVKEASVSKSRGHYHLGSLSDQGYLDIDPLVMLDGVPVFNMDKVFAIDPLKVRKLEVVKNRYYWQAAVMDGIFSFTTYKGDLGGYEIDPKAVVIDYEGLQQEREFYSPVYDTEQQVSSRMPDLRNLLYWSPSVIADQAGKGHISFYTSDKIGKYIGIIQGLSATGEAGSQVFSFEVKPNYTAGIGK